MWWSMGCFLKCLYCPKWSTDSMQLLSKFQWHFPQKSNKDSKHLDRTTKDSNGLNNLEKEEQSWRRAPWFQTILQGYRNENCMVLSLKKTHRSMEHKKQPHNKLMNIYIQLFRDKRANYIQRGKDSLFNKWWENWIVTWKRMKWDYYLI